MKFDHVALTVKDIEASVKWYCDKFSASIIYKDETWAMLEIGGIKVALTLKSQHPPHFAFSVESVNDIPSSMLGVHRDSSVYSYIRDPDGNVVEVLCYPKPKE